jgi:hypothetical protein
MTEVERNIASSETIVVSRPGIFLDTEPDPAGEPGDVDVDEPHRAGERGDAIGDPALDALRSLFGVPDQRRVAVGRE